MGNSVTSSSRLHRLLLYIPNSRKSRDTQFCDNGYYMGCGPPNGAENKSWKGAQPQDRSNRGGENNLEQDLAAVLRLESQSRKFSVSLLVTALALVIFLLLEFEYLLERSFCYGRRNLVFAVKVL